MTHHSTAFLSSKTQLHLALVILNVELQHDLSVQSSIFTHLWREAGVRLCADGAANRLHDSLADADRGRLLPDLIKGDLDSIRDDVAALAKPFYSRTHPTGPPPRFDTAAWWAWRSSGRVG